MATCLTCGGPARNGLLGYKCAACDQNKLLKQQNKIQKDSLNLQYKMSGIKPPPEGVLGHLGRLIMAFFGLIGWGIKNHKEIDEFNNTWMSFCLRHWKILSVSFVAIIILAAIVGSFQKP